MTDAMAMEPRPSAKQAAMRGVELEQVSVPAKPKPGVAPKPSSKGEKLEHRCSSNTTHCGLRQNPT